MDCSVHFSEIEYQLREVALPFFSMRTERKGEGVKFKKKWGGREINRKHVWKTSSFSVCSLFISKLHMKNNEMEKKENPQQH